MKKLLVGLFTFVSLIILSACGSNTLEGDYTGTINLLWIESDVTMRFDGDTVTFQGDEQIDDGDINIEEMDSGTYEIDDDQLTIIVDGYTIKASLSDDRDSFAVTEDDFDVYSGVTFSKEN